MNKAKSIMYDVSVVIPAKNEEDRLPVTLSQLSRSMTRLNVSHQIIVVNDGSFDSTSYRAKLGGALVVDHTSNKGIAAAFRSGVKISRGRTIMLCPADIRDFSFLSAGLQASKVFDVVSVSKRHSDSVVIGYNKWRWFLSNGYQKCVSLLFGQLEICTDTHYIKFYNGKILRSIINKCRLNGPVGETEIMLYAKDIGSTFFEIPARIIHNGDGSKTSFTLLLRTMNELMHLWAHRKLNSWQSN